jgi:Type IIA topoisomerase (DNA gyrase/topo II, topoisomerase IV), B subunit
MEETEMTPVPTNGAYDESKVKTLSSLEHIRLRPGMYVGRMGDGSHPDDGIYVLLKEVIDNSVDEYIMGHGRRIDIAINGNELSVRDYGRGIPLGKLVACVSQINTGAKYNTDVFQFSVGLNGVGTKAVNALSDFFSATSYRDGKFKCADFSGGKNSEGGERRNCGTQRNFHQIHPRFQAFPEIQHPHGVCGAPSVDVRLSEQRTFSLPQQSALLFQKRIDGPDQ